MSLRRGLATVLLALFVVSAQGARANAAECPNEEMRIGPSAGLPDCRAYELVTPGDTNGRLVASLGTLGTPPNRQMVASEIASPSRDSVAFLSSQSPLPEIRGATGVADLYEAERGAGGWLTTRLLTAGGAELRMAIPEGVSSDHRYAVIATDDSSSALSIGKTETVYLGKPDGSFELLGLGRIGSEPYAQPRHLGDDGHHIVFSTGKDFSNQSVWCSGNPKCKVVKLEPDAPPTGTGAVYDREADGETKVVSLLPGDITPVAGEEAFYRGTSKDASATAFEIAGTLYVRLRNEETVEVAGGSPIFAGLSEDGRYVFYVVPAGSGEAGTIHRFDTENDTDLEINPGNEGMIVNVSGDGSHVYFISESLIDGEGEVDMPNLFVWTGGSPEFITTVAPSDLERTSGDGTGLPALANWTGWVTNRPKSGDEQGPGAESSRTTPDGTVLVFESRAQLTAYENANHTEIYRYDDEAKSLSCVSCNPTAEPATADARLEELARVTNPAIIHNLSDDGSRVFFETAEALVSEDGDGINDIYQWSAEEGGGGELGLISSGRSVAYPLPEGVVPGPAELNVLLSVTPNSRDVIFLTQDALVPGAPGGNARSIYDARVNGGFLPPVEPVPCLEDGCKTTPFGSVLSFSTAPSESLRGSGNLKRAKHKRRCRRVNRRKHKHCSRHRAARSSRAANPQPGLTEKTESGAHSPLAGPLFPESNTQSEPVSKAVEGAAEYGIETVGAGESSGAAGSHPDFTTEIALHHFFNESGFPDAKARTEEVAVAIPPGLLGNPNVTPRCKTVEFVALNCPIDAQVGTATVLSTLRPEYFTEPVYNLAPPHPEVEVARFGFTGVLFPIFIDVKIRTAGNYGATATVYGSSGYVSLLSAETTLWGSPADPSHDEERLTAIEAFACTDSPCKSPPRPSGLSPSAFMTNPSACQAMEVDFTARSYQLPGQTFTASAPLAPITDCTGLPFAPSFEAEPTNHTAGAPTGLKTKLVLPQHLMADERATATMREARVTLPEGMQVAAGAANWIGTCSDSQVGYHEEVDTACPDNSKLGTATITSPALSTPIEGTIYQRSPQPGHQLGLWLTADALGMHIKLPGSLEPDKTTGRLTAVFTDLPQVPVEEIDLNVWGGPRAPLQNPDHCGTFTTDFSFSPHSNDPAATGQSQMQINEGCNQGFDPTLHAGVTEPVAAKYSPFVFDLTRPDGNQALRGFELKLPDGELAKLKSVPLCSDADAAAANCPQGSRIGSLQATTGPGPDPFTLPQPGKPQPQIYLSGPYKGSPFSIVTEVPAQAGPFDLGTLAVRSGLDVEPETGRAVVKADPLPQFFEGVGIAYRNLHAVVDRPEFSLNPTDCREMAVNSDVTSTQGTVAHPQARFQVDGCKALKFKSKLSLKLRGGTKRADYPALTAVLKARKGDANIAFASVALPHSEFLAQEHIGTICTRKQFAADKCPKKSVYGKAKAITPLLDKPLSGPVYLRSSDHPLPDLVAKLDGQLEIDLVGRIDSKNGGIRTTFESVPDAPVRKFVLQMRGGKKGLLTNSTDICRGSHRATVAMKAQNGRAAQLRPLLMSGGCGH